MRLRSEPVSRLRENQDKENELFLKIALSHFFNASSQQEFYRVQVSLISNSS